MSSNSDRFYQLTFKNRPVLYGDIGSLMKIDGLVVGGAGVHAVLLLPSSSYHNEEFEINRLTDDEWSDYIQRSDVPEIMVGPAKVFLRKAQYEISGSIQQKVWVADSFRCMYCKRKMGDVQLTIDHFIPLELGGVNNQTNYLSACRRCNKDKGSQDPKVYLRLEQYMVLKDYLKHRKIPGVG